MIAMKMSASYFDAAISCYAILCAMMALCHADITPAVISVAADADAAFHYADFLLLFSLIIDGFISLIFRHYAILLLSPLIFRHAAADAPLMPPCPPPLLLPLLAQRRFRPPPR